MKRNLFWIKLDYFFGGLWLLAPLVIIYFQSITKSYAMAMAVFSIANLSTLIFEVPSGVLSDFWGRKKTLFLCGVFSLLCGVFWALAGTVDSVFLLFFGALFLGMSDAFLSGTDEALMYETMENLGQKERFGTFFAEACQWNQLGLALSAFIGGGIVYYFSLVTLAWVSVVPLLLGFVTICFLVEPQRSKPSVRQSSLSHCGEAIKLFIQNKKLRFFSILQVIYAATCFPISRLEGAYFEKLIPLWMVNIIAFLKQLCSLFGFWLAAHIQKKRYLTHLMNSFLGNGLLYLIGLIINSVISPFLMMFSQIFYGPITTIETDILQQEFSEKQRATLKSILSLMEKLLSSLLFVCLGILADVFSVWSALSCIILVRLFLAMAVLVYKKTCNQ